MPITEGPTVPENTPFDFARDLFPKLMEMGQPLFGLPMEGYWRDIGEPESYHQANLDALHGRLRLPGEAETPEERRTPAPRRYRCSLSVEAPRRARLMREVSAALMEAGADFTDGITLNTVPGGLHIAASGASPAVLVESDDPATAERYRQLVDNINLN